MSLSVAIEIFRSEKVAIESEFCERAERTWKRSLSVKQNNFVSYTFSLHRENSAQAI